MVLQPQFYVAICGQNLKANHLHPLAQVLDGSLVGQRFAVAQGTHDFIGVEVGMLSILKQQINIRGVRLVGQQAAEDIQAERDDKELVWVHGIQALTDSV